MGRPINDAEHIEEIKTHKLEEKRRLENGEEFEILSGPRGHVLGPSGKYHKHLERYFVLSTLPEDIDANVDGTIVRKDEDAGETIGDWQLYYQDVIDDADPDDTKNIDVDDATAHDLAPMFPYNVLNNHHTKTDNNNGSPQKKRKSNSPKNGKKTSKKTYNKKKSRGAVLYPPNPVYVGLIVKKAIQVLATTDLLDYKKDVYAKVVKHVRLFVIAPVGKYLPAQSDPRWTQMRQRARGKS